MLQSIELLNEMLGHGGLAVDCAAADGMGQARLTLQLDGSTFLRCTASAGALADAVGAALVALAGRISNAANTFKAARTAADALVLGITVAMAFTLSALAGTARNELLRPLFVFAAYLVLTPLRSLLLRFVVRQALRLALRMER